MSKNHADVWDMLDDMTETELETLGNLVAGLNRLEIRDEAPVYSTEEMDLIGRFQELNDDEDDPIVSSSDDPIAEDNTENPSDGSEQPATWLEQAAATVRNSDVELS